MPGTERKRAKPPQLATLVRQTQAELAATVEALRAHGTRLAVLRRQLRARIPYQKFALALATFEHTLPTALACGLDEQLAQIARLVAELEASVAATEANPDTRPCPEELVLVELLGRRDRFAAQLLKSYRHDQQQAAGGARPQALPERRSNALDLRPSHAPTPEV